MNHYEQKQAVRKERLEARAAKLRQNGESIIGKARDMESIIPFGQPILVGHHSEKSDRNYRAKISNGFQKGFKTLKAADEADARAEGAGKGGISSDDPDAISKLKAELERLEELQTKMAAANKLIRKGDKVGLASAGFSEERIAQLFTKDCMGEVGFPAYRLQNNSANIRRIRLRIGSLALHAGRESKQTLHEGGVRIVENAEQNRLQLFFDGKPSEEIRAKLKSAGFRWAPSEGAWQRQLSNGAIYAANYLLNNLKGGDSATFN